MAVQSIHQFAEKVVLITDGTSPVGRAVAIQMALQGAYVICGFSSGSSGSSDPLNALRELGTLATSVDADIASVSGAKFLVEEAAKSFGRIDMLINCLKSEPESSFEDTDEAGFDAGIDRGLKAAFFVTQAATDLLKQRPKPKVVNVFSACDTDESSNNPLFASTQAAIREFTHALSKSLPTQFRVNGVAVSERKKAFASDAELFRPQNVLAADDAARTVVYLLSSEATGLNGQVLNVG